MFSYGILLVKSDIDPLPSGKDSTTKQHSSSELITCYSYYRGSVGALLVYDITRHDTFEDIIRWLNEIRMNDAHPETVIMLVGNKSDLEQDQRAVSQEEAAKFAKDHGLMFMETSALDRSNVNDAFDTLIHQIFDKLSSRLTTLSDKQAMLMRGETIKLDHTPSSTTTTATGNQNGCAC